MIRTMEHATVGEFRSRSLASDVNILIIVISDFIGYTQQHNDNAEVDSEDEMRPTLSGRRSCILPDSQESNGVSDVAGDDLSVETDLVKTKEETAELTHGLQSNGKALEDAAERTEDSIKDKEEEQSEDEKETDPVLICLR